MTAFFTRASPLSNHHDSPMKVEGQSFKSNEQYYMFKKATTFADKETADAIMRESDPGKIKGFLNFKFLIYIYTVPIYEHAVN